MNTMNQNNNSLKQGSILAVASLVTRMIGMLYKIPLTYIVGEAGMTYYNTAYEVYNIALILSSLSIPVAVSKLISAKDQTKEYAYSMKIYRIALILGSVTGGIAGAVVFIFAPQFAHFLEYPSAVYALRVLGPTILVVAVLGVIRGLFQGKKNMVPTAVSQVFEQIINAVISIVAAVIFMTVGSSDQRAALGAAGGTFGTLSGAVAAVLFMMFIYQINAGYFQKQVRKDTHEYTFENAQIFKMVFLTMLPIILSQLVYQLSGIVDTKIFGYYMRSIGRSEEDRASVYEAYSNKYRQLTNIPIAIATALSAAIIPTLSGLTSVGNQKEARVRIASSLKLNMIIAIPAAVGMGVLGPQIVYLLYRTYSGDVMGGTGGMLLRIGSTAIVFFAYSTMTNGILQGISHMKTPVVNAAVSLMIHVGLLFFMLFILKLEVIALVIGNVSFALTVCILNSLALKRYLLYRQEVIKTFLCPLAASIVMGAFVWLIYSGLYSGLSMILGGQRYIPNLIATLISILLGIIVYLLGLGVLKTADEEELKEYPMGVRFIKIYKKLKLL